MAKLKAQFIIEAEETQEDYGTMSHPPYWYLAQRKRLNLTSTGSGGYTDDPNPASHPPPWALKDMIIDTTYSEGSDYKQKLDNADGFIKIISTGSSITGVASGAGARLRDAKLIVVKNCGSTAVELLIETNEHSHADETRSNAMYNSMIIGSGDFIVLPNQRMVSYSNNTSAGNASSVDNINPYSTAGTSDQLYIDSTADITEAFTGDSDTVIQIDDGSGGAGNNFFRVGDTIRINDEILEITAITDVDGDGNFTPTSLTVKRGLYGSTKANHANNDAIRFAFFNEYADFDKFTYAQTDRSGKYKTSNLIMNAGQRVSSSYSRGIVRGSFAMKFYESGYQELGLSGITSTTSSGLAVSTTYQFNITANGSGAISIAFTTDSSNVNFGGTNGVIAKINDALKTQFNTFGGNLYEEEVTLGIVNGDLRFTSNDRTSASAILLADSSGSDTDLWGVGRFPDVANVEAPVSAQLPDDTLYDDKYIGSPNSSAFAYDDGNGNIIGSATGKINYETSAIDITSGPALAEFVVSFNYGSAHSGGINETANFENGIISIQARSCNSKINGEVQVLGFM